MSHQNLLVNFVISELFEMRKLYDKDRSFERRRLLESAESNLSALCNSGSRSQKPFVRIDLIGGEIKHVAIISILSFNRTIMSEENVEGAVVLINHEVLNVTEATIERLEFLSIGEIK